MSEYLVLICCRKSVELCEHYAVKKLLTHLLWKTWKCRGIWQLSV